MCRIFTELYHRNTWFQNDLNLAETNKQLNKDKLSLLSDINSDDVLNVNKGDSFIVIFYTGI